MNSNKTLNKEFLSVVRNSLPPVALMNKNTHGGSPYRRGNYQANASLGHPAGLPLNCQNRFHLKVFSRDLN
jgi:hypothetical protein